MHRGKSAASGKPAERQPRPRRPVITDAETEGVRDRNIIWKLRGKAQAERR